MSARTPPRFVFFAIVAFSAAGCGIAAAAPPESSPKPTGASGSGSGVALSPRVAVDLLHNRVHASSHRQGHLVIEAGSADFLKYTDGGWKTSWILNDKDQGAAAALVSGLSAQLFIPLDTDGDGAGGTALGDSILAFTVRALAPNRRFLSSSTRSRSAR